MGLVPALRRPLVGAVAVGDDQRFPLRVLRHEALQRLAVGHLNPHASRIELVDDLDSADENHLAYRAATLPSADGISLLPVRHVRLVDLHDAPQQLPVRIDHRAAELMEQQPGGLVAGDAELGLEL